MKKSSILKIAAVAIALNCGFGAIADPGQSPDIKDILNMGGGALGNIVEGVFTKSDLKVSDLVGEWTSTGCAVTFQSDNFLKKAGGTAAAGAIESKLDPYYKKIGLTGAVLTVDEQGNFSLKIKMMTLKGTIAVKSKGVFTLSFKALGNIGLGSMDAYVEKSPSALNVMFDADKIKKLMSLAATLSGNKMVATADKILKEYDGICLGFKMKQNSADQNAGAGSKANGKTGSSATDAAVDALKGIFGK